MFVQKDIDLLLSHSKTVRIMAVLYDENYQEIDSLQGNILAAPVSKTSDSDIRSSCSVNILVNGRKDSNLDFESLWIDRMVEISYGVLDPSTNDYVWYRFGKMLITDSRSTYNKGMQEVKMSIVDLMAALTEAKGSQIGSPMLIPAGTNIRNALLAIVSEYAPYKRCNIPEFEDVIPYDINIEIGTYPYQSLKTIMDLFPYYEMLYDIDGVFTVREIPTKIEDPVDISYEIIDQILLNENTEDRSARFSDVKNTVEIWGKSLDALYTATSCVSNGSCYNLFIIDSFETLVVGETYGFTPDIDSVYRQSIKIQETPECQIFSESGAGKYTLIAEGALRANVPYVVKYVDDKFVLLGELEVHTIVQEIKEAPSIFAIDKFKRDNACNDVEWVINPDSPFACIENSIHGIDRQKKIVLSGGEYGNIYSTSLAIERGRYELWQKTRLQDTVSLRMLLVPWLDVNDKISYTSPSSGEVVTIIVKSISFDFPRWSMSVSGSKFYPVYPW